MHIDVFSCSIPLPGVSITWIIYMYYQYLLRVIRNLSLFVHKYFQILNQKRLHKNLKYYYKVIQVLRSLGSLSHSLRLESTPYLEKRESSLLLILLFSLFGLFLLAHNLSCMFYLPYHIFKR